MSHDSDRCGGAPPHHSDADRLRGERDDARLVLDHIYEHLAILEPTLTTDQVLLCPVDAAKWRKEPEFTERARRLLSPEGASSARAQLDARRRRLNAAQAVDGRGGEGRR